VGLVGVAGRVSGRVSGRVTGFSGVPDPEFEPLGDFGLPVLGLLV